MATPAPQVHILATVRNPALLQATTLVFKTLRLGFPKAIVHVWGNGLEWFAESEIAAACSATHCLFTHLAYRAHDSWVEALLHGQQAPFWICDTDMVFFAPVEEWFVAQPLVNLAGRFEPEFDEEFTRSRHMARLHTALMYFNPHELRILMREWMSQVPPPWGLSSQMNLIRQNFVALRYGPTLFFDTCAGLWHAGLGQEFTPEQNAHFEHLHCGTYVDKIGRVPSLKDLAAVHRGIYADPSSARGLQHKQSEYYASRKPDTLVIHAEGAHIEKG